MLTKHHGGGGRHKKGPPKAENDGRPKGRVVFKNGKMVHEGPREEELAAWEAEQAVRADKVERERQLRAMTEDEQYEIFEMAGYFKSADLEAYRRKRFFCQQFGPSLGKERGEYLDAVHADWEAAREARERKEREAREEAEKKAASDKRRAEAAERERLAEIERMSHIKTSNIDVEDDGLSGEELRKIEHDKLMEAYGEAIPFIIKIQTAARGRQCRKLLVEMKAQWALEQRILNPHAGDRVVERNVLLGGRVQRSGAELAGEWPEHYANDGAEHELGTVVGYRLSDGSVGGVDPGLKLYAAVRWDAQYTRPGYSVYPIGAPMEMVKGVLIGHADGTGLNFQELHYLAHANGIDDECISVPNVKIGTRVVRGPPDQYHLPSNDAQEDTKLGEERVLQLRKELREKSEYLELRVAACEQCPAHLETLFEKRRKKALRAVDECKAALRAVEAKLHRDRLYWDYDGENRSRSLAAGTVVGIRDHEGRAKGDVPPRNRPRWVTVHWDDCQQQQELSIGEVDLSMGDPLQKDGAGYGKAVYNLFAAEHTGRRQAMQIQPNWRGFWGRKRAACGRRWVLDMQRLYRGHTARRAVRRMMGLPTSSEEEDSDDDDEDDDDDDEDEDEEEEEGEWDGEEADY